MVDFFERLRQIDTIEEAREVLFSQTSASNPNIQKACRIARHFHEGQYRKSGIPYIVHPILVAAIVAYFGGDEKMIIAALLHDTVEDTECSIEEVEKTFGKEVARLVEGLTKITEIRDEELVPSTSDEKLITSALSFRKMLLASIDDVRVLVIKLCDRLHNMMTLGALSPAKQKRIAEETLVVYAPIAHRLGISTIKNMLEDLSFYYLMPEEYKKIDDYIAKYRQRFMLELNGFISRIKTLMLKNGFLDGTFSIEKRIKHHYSIYTKMQRKGITIEEVLDLLAIRILVKEPLDCYRELGIIHLNFKPLISRFKDYIALPKENGYQTIHTTVFHEASIFEVQIRTFTMHKTAELGVAAHWKYKGHEGLTPNLGWLDELRTQSEAGENIEQMYELAKSDLYTEEISVYSPKGDVFTLPRGATVLDFAYAIHTEVGDHATSAYVNKQKTPLLTELKNGDIVRIVTGREPIHRCSWISSVKTAKAKNAMRQSCNHKRKELNHKTAFNILVGTFNIKPEFLQRILEKEKMEKNLYRAAVEVDYLQEILYKLKKIILKESKFIPLIPPFRKYTLKKQQFDHILIYAVQSFHRVLFDYCCHPKQGDEIVAFRKNGEATVHHKFCSHAQALMDKHRPMVFVTWTTENPNHYKLIVSLENKKGALASFLLFLAKMDINLLTIELAKSENSHVDYFELVVDIPPEKKEKILKETSKNFKIIEFISLDDAYKK
ncbi:MAG: bifunctional (p)ppGpp synthase/hydrolase [Campylobacteraceae bacterium 4484_4]|nr:MAG: bifunctional (p)ppGpp synthase/hydrolase [Campylobacteraceae bacterium 4484_4]